MRQNIDSAPKDRKLVIPGEDASATYDLAHWSAEAGQWIGKNSKPSKITPSHWHPNSARNYLPQRNGLARSLGDASISGYRARRHRFFPLFWIVAVAAALVGLCFHADVGAYVARYGSQQRTLGPPVMAQQLRLPKDGEAPQFKQAVDSATANLRQSLQQERDWANALETELVKQRRDVDMLLADFETLLSEHKIIEAERLKQAVDSATADLRKSLQQERDKARALETEMANERLVAEQKTAAVEEQSVAWANSNALVNEVQTAGATNSAMGTSKSATKPFEPARAKQVPRGRHDCRYFRTLVISRLATNDWLACWLFGPTIAMRQHSR